MLSARLSALFLVTVALGNEACQSEAEPVGEAGVDKAVADLMPVTTEQPSEAAKDFFRRTAGGLVACYQALGVLQPAYDEEGRCDDSARLSAWTLTPRGAYQVSLAGFVARDSRQELVGDYEGRVTFPNERGQTCEFGLVLDYSGEDIVASTKGFRCQ